jgi:hypothetical protein
MAFGGAQSTSHPHMTNRLVARIVAGEGPVAFAPYAWADLPGFVKSTAPDEWWVNVDFCQRALADAGGVCKADAVLVPLLDEHALQAISERTEEPADIAAEITSLDAVFPGLALVDQMVAVGSYDAVAVLPPLADLAEALQGAESEDLEDALCHLTREALDRGASAIAVRGPVVAQVEQTVTRLAQVADYFGTQVLGLTPDRGWASHGGITVEVCDLGSRWPQQPGTLVLTYADLSTSCSAADVRRWVTDRDCL